MIKLMNFCMIKKENKYLVLDKKKVQGWEGLTFPGGKVEKNESFQESVIREVKEETGLNLHSVKLKGVLQWEFKDGSRDVVFMYESLDFSGEILKNPPEGPVFWMDKEEFLKADNHALEMKAYLKLLEDDSIDEAYIYYKEENNEFKFLGPKNI